MIKQFATIFATASLFISPFAQAERFKISTAYPDGTAVLKTLKTAAKEIKTQTGERVDFKFYPGGTMGDNQTVLKRIQSGKLQGALIEGGAMARYFKDSQIYNAPMVFNSYEEVDYVRAEMDPVIRQGFMDAGWRSFGLIEGGFAYAMTNKPVYTIDDLKSQKLWLPANDPLTEKVASALGLSPIFLPISGVLTSLQTGAVNAIASPPVGALTLQWYSKVDYVTNVPFMYTYALLAMDEKQFQVISAEDQIIVNTVFEEAFIALDRLNRADNLKAFDALTDQGLTVVEPDDVQKAQLETAAANATTLLVQEGEFSQEMLDKLNKLLSEKRSGN